MAAGYVESADRERAHLVAVWVALEWRGSGAAERLVTAVCDWAAAIPVDEIALWVAGENERAVRFYERMGFARVPKESQPWSPDPAVCEVYMVKRLYG
jgi:ribosomal protein S18 acetylase RimI-like enzyme